MVLAIAAPALADDLNPPDWAIGPGTIYGIWNFPSADSGQEGDYPEEGAMEPHATNPDPEELTSTSDPDEFAHQYMEVSYASDDLEWLESHEGREGVMTNGGMSFWANNFPGAGTKLIRLQVTWTGSEISIFYIGAFGGTFGDEDEWFPLSEDVLIETVPLSDGWSHSTYEFLLEGNPDWEWVYVGATGNGPIYLDQIVIDTICYPGYEPPDGQGRDVVPAPILVDPNVMTVYETDETEGDFDVSMRNPMEPETSVTVTIDPNSDDITLIGSAPDGTITMIFDANNWDVPQTVVFKAIDDEIPDPPDLEESVRVLLSSVYSEPLQDPNWAGEKIATVKVVDNDQANILFRATPARGGTRVPVIGPVQLWEQYTASDLLRWRKIGFQLQLQPMDRTDPCNPLPTSVKLYAVVEEVEDQPGGDNLPPTDPCLPLQETDDPNCFTFTSTTSSNGLGTGCADHDVANRTTCWNVDQDVKIWGNDDDVLQVEAFADGDEDYQAVLSVWVIDDGGDERYATLTENAASLPGAGADAGPKTVDFDIEDNECGAFGIVPGDVSNRFYMTDPNYEAGDPDCYVDIYDVIGFVTEWLDCSDIHYPSCESYLED